MVETVHHLILHVVFILFTILVFQMVTSESDSGTKGFTFKFFLMNLAILLFTMIFPVVYSSGYVYDFKVIPIILAFLYGGKKVGFSTFIALLVMGWFTHHVWIFLVVNYAIYGVLLIPLSKWYKRLSWKNKLILISAFYLFVPVTRTLFLLQNNELEQLPLVASSTLIIWITLILTIYLIENRLEQVRIKKELIKAEKFNVVSELAASVAHEIRNPMTTVRGFMQLLQRETLTKEQKSFIDISIQELDHAQDVINQYLSLAKPQTEEYEVFSLTDTLNESVDVMSTYAVMNSIKINKNMEDGLMIKGMKIEVKQVLLNLLKNAIEAVKENGEITAAAHVQKDGRIMIVIQDNGVGMPPEQLKVLGRPYYSTKEKGTGLGLTVSYQIVKRMKGEIQVESEPGQGTVFRVFLPGSV
ncbi:ATP-binding protein [Rossellomorea aquimaris]|uniref:histidine kinase n=1 Tax=Rossellomorea aquimaris TaxID=189382 RepID=A0A366EHC7_9BACI|nr:ATP-binding protein [Rossellomorea aquimaris]RBP00849.1 two-component system sporulation sensor kinase B [Rossellomorea aquimaris]